MLFTADYPNTATKQIGMKKYQACASVNAIAMHGMPDFRTGEEIKIVTLEDDHLSALAELILHHLPSTKAEVYKELQPYWSFGDEITSADWIAIKE